MKKYIFLLILVSQFVQAYICGYRDFYYKNDLVLDSECKSDTEVISKIGFDVNITNPFIKNENKCSDMFRFRFGHIFSFGLSSCSAKFHSRMEISAGSYFYDELRIEDNSQIVLSGKVSIFAKKIYIGSNVKINYNGSPSDLFLGVYGGGLIVNQGSKISANMFVDGDLELKTGVDFSGLFITKGKFIDSGKNFNIVKPNSHKYQSDVSGVASENSGDLIYKFSIYDINSKNETISTKIAGEKFNLKIDVEAFKEIDNKKSKISGIYYDTQMRWSNAKLFCQSKGKRLPKIVELEKIRDDFIEKDITGEFWSLDEINPRKAYMFRFVNGHTKLWVEKSQKFNFKKVYCVDGGDLPLQPVEDFELDKPIQVSLVGVDGVEKQSIDFGETHSKIVTFLSNQVSQDVRVKIEYGGKEFYSKDHFAIRPDHFHLEAVDEVKAGKNFFLIALAENGKNSIVSNYNETNLSSLDLEYRELKAGCKLGKLSGDEKVEFKNGESSTSLKYSEIGEVNFTLSEKAGYEFANIDRNDTPDEVRYIKPASKIVKFAIAKLIVNSKLDNSLQGYTYIANQLNEMNGTITIDIQAVNSENQIVENFFKECYSEDVNLTIPLEVESKSKDITMVLFDGEQKEIPIRDSVLNIQKSISKNKIVEKGRYQTTLYLNFKRETNRPVSPIQVKIAKNLEVENFEYSSSAVGDLLFLYARMVVEDRETTKSSLSVPYIYEVYLDEPEKYPNFGKASFEPHWHRDIIANKIFDNRIELIPPSDSKLDIEKNRISLNDPEGWNRSYIIEVEAPQYLLYNKYDTNLTRGNFEVGFYKEDEEEFKVTNSDDEGDGVAVDILNKSLKLPHRRVDW